MKEIKGEKYIYLAMAYRLAKENGGQIKIGHDNGYRGSQMFERYFIIENYNNLTLLVEKKNNASFADFSRMFLVNEFADGQRPYIQEYINEHGDNCSVKWEH